jgi:hypothetical protein
MAQPATAHPMQTAIAVAHLKGVGLGTMGRLLGCGHGDAASFGALPRAGCRTRPIRLADFAGRTCGVGPIESDYSAW